MTSKSTTLLLLALTPTAFAHEGHGTIDNLWAHYAFEPAHGLGLLMVLLVIAGAWRHVVRRQRVQR